MNNYYPNHEGDEDDNSYRGLIVTLIVIVIVAFSYGLHEELHKDKHKTTPLAETTIESTK